MNAVNAPILARERGINVVEVRTRRSGGFRNALRVQFNAPTGTNVLEGAVFGADVIRLVQFDGFHFEALPEGDILILHNRDVPGVVGNVGTFLARQGVNIARLELGRVGGEAISFVHVDSPLDPAQLDELRGLPDITGATMVRLD